MAIRPVPEMYPITQNYYGGFSAALTGSSYHGGVDYGAPTGTATVSPESGTVVFADWAWNLPGGANDFHLRWYQAKPAVGNRSGGGGLMVVIRNSVGSHWLMAHLSRIDVKAGQTVQAGTVVGAIGSTGLSTGPHLHLGLVPPNPNWNNRAWGAIDPQPYITEPYRSIQATAWSTPKTSGTGTAVTTNVSGLPAYKLETADTPNYTPSRPTPATSFTIHQYDAKGTAATHDSVVRHFTNPASQVSAHYVVSRNRVTRLVHPDFQAWHARSGNASSIGIELDPNNVEGSIITAAALIRDVRKTVPTATKIVPHSDWVATACPGEFKALIPRIEAMARTGLMEETMALSDADINKIVTRLLDTKLPTRGLEQYELSVRECLAWQGDSRNKINQTRSLVQKLADKAGIK